MFNARHILLKPEYTSEDMENAYKTLDSLRTEILSGAVTFSLAAKFYSQDPATRTNGGQMSDPTTGSTYFEIDKLKPQDYAAIQYLKEGEISKPVESLDNEGRSGNTVYKTLKIDKVLPAHPATYEHDYNLLSGMAKQQKSMDAINKFVDEKIVQTHIIIDPIFKDCPFERSELSNKIRK
jgi:peptidyl-prolyl cis-trans isomerase SurA